MNEDKKEEQEKAAPPKRRRPPQRRVPLRRDALPSPITETRIMVPSASLQMEEA